MHRNKRPFASEPILICFCQKVCYINTDGIINILKETILKRTTRSLLEELNSISIKKNGEAVIEARATHVIDSAINLLAVIKENYSPEDAYELERRLINSIKGGDPNKFVRSIRKLRDLKETAKGLKVIDGAVKSDD
jgi:hypothetical protein